jgi:hypothetical protein
MISILDGDINRLEQFLNTEFRRLVRVIATVGDIAAVLWTDSPMRRVGTSANEYHPRTPAPSGCSDC